MKNEKQTGKQEIRSENNWEAKATNNAEFIHYR